MRMATTKQFRNAVREAASASSSTLSGSWTDSLNHNLSNPTRYVGFVAYGKAKVVATLAEALLNLQGLTANTRTGRTSKYMVRGTCVKV